MPRVTQGILPLSPGIEPGWADDIQCWSSNSSLANGAGSFLCVAGYTDYRAAAVPWQGMPWEKVASYTYSKYHRSPWPVQAAYIPHYVYAYTSVKLLIICEHKERNLPKILKLELWFLIFWSWWCSMFVILLLEEGGRTSMLEHFPSSSGSGNWSCYQQAACVLRRLLRKCCILLCGGLSALVACVPQFGNLCYRSGRDSLWIRILHSQSPVRG